MKFLVLLSTILSTVVLVGCSNTSPLSTSAEFELREKTGFHKIPLDSKGTKTYSKIEMWPGKTIEIISTDTVTLPQSNQIVKRLMYKTKLPMAMDGPLQDEMIEVWSRFTVDLSLEKAQVGMITAVETPKKGDKYLMTYTRAYQIKDNSWRPVIK